MGFLNEIYYLWAFEMKYTIYGLLNAIYAISNNHVISNDHFVMDQIIAYYDLDHNFI